MTNLQYVAPCLFGLEGIAGDELRRLGMENVKVEDRRVLFTGDLSALAKANICAACRSGEFYPGRRPIPREGPLPEQPAYERF